MTRDWLELLRRQLPLVERGALDGWWEEFSRVNPNQNFDSFVQFLVNEKISDPLLTEQLQKLRIEEQTVDEEKTIQWDSQAENVHVEESTSIPQLTARLGDQNFTLMDSLGEGGTGAVYLAHDNELDRRVAFKQLWPAKAENPVVLRRFMREAQITAQLIHPSITPVYGLTSGVDGKPAYTMQAIEGVTLTQLLERVRIAVTENEFLGNELQLRTRLEYFRRVCDAMAYAHSRGILHRDLKPDNIMIGAYNQVYVMDWGIARRMGVLAREDSIDYAMPQEATDLQVVEELDGATRVGQLVGTPQYMSPEQVRGFHRDLDERSDIYSMGIILYRMVFLKQAFKQTTLMNLLDAILEGDIQPFEAFDSRVKVPHELVAIIRKATHRLPSERYRSVEEFSADINRFLRGQTVLAAPENIFQRTGRWISNHQEWVSYGLVLLFFGLVTVSFWSINRHQKMKLTHQAKIQRTVTYLNDATEHSHRIDNELVRFEAILGELATATQVLLSQEAENKNAKFYLSESFNPPDIRESEFYQDNMSPYWPVIKVAPDVHESVSAPVAQRLVTLFPFLRQSLLKTHAKSMGTLVREELTEDEVQVLSEEGFPALSSFVAAAEGVIALYPGRGGYPSDYDPRKRPWFRSAITREGLMWNDPYVSSQKHRSVTLGCATAVRDNDGTVLAVAGLDMKLGYLSNKLDKFAEEIPWIRKSYLLDSNGRVIGESGRIPDKIAGTHVINEAVKKNAFWNSEIVASVQSRGRGGIVEAKINNRRVILAFSPLDALGWYYVGEGY